MIPYIVLDIETKDSRGASLESYRHDFEIWSIAAAWRDDKGNIQTYFTMGEDRVKRFLFRVSELNIPVIVHNLTFEMGCFKARFPDLTLNWHADTMRLAQNADGGGKEYGGILTPEDELKIMEGKSVYYKTGLSLENCATRFLKDELKDHKNEAHSWLEKHHGVKTRHGMYLHLLPHDLLKRYNEADVIVTLELYESLIALFKLDGFDWTLDASIYQARCEFIVDMYHSGTWVDRESLAKYIYDLRDEISQIENAFKTTYRKELSQLREINYKNKKSRSKSSKKIQEIDEMYEQTPELFCLNFNSNKQLAYLFVDVMGLKPKFFTEKEAPSFKAAHLSSWGPAGDLLLIRRKRQLVLKQAENLFMLSQYDNKWHANLRACGARTGRMSGSS